MDYNLSQNELEALRKAHRATRDRRLADRIKVVYDLGRGWKPEDVADCLMLDETTVRQYFHTYKEKGVEGLLRMAYVGSESRLTQEQKSELSQYLDQNLTQTKKRLSNTFIRRTRFAIPGPV